MRLAAILAALAGGADAAMIGQMTPAEPVTAARVAGLEPAERPAWTAYLVRTEAARARNAAVATPGAPPPAGNAQASMPLDRPAAWYGSAEARHVADVIVSFQTPAGGWSKNSPRDGALRQAGQPYAAEAGYVGTLDNDATVTELRFLARVITAAPSAAYRDSFARGLRWLLDAQYPNGGWPQVWPLVGGYHDAVTLNDGAMLHALQLLQAVAGGRGDYAFVPAAQRREADAAFRRGLEALLSTRPIGGAWPQQADALDFAAVGARNFEPAAYATAESAEIVGWLMTLPDPSQRAVNAVHETVEWLDKAVLKDKAWEAPQPGQPRRLIDRPGARLWARFYDLGPNRPMFGDRDRTIHDDVADLSAERQAGYAWFGTWPAKVLDRYEAWAATHGYRK